MGELGPWVVLTETIDRAHYLRVDRPAKARPSNEPKHHPYTERWWKRAGMKPGGFVEEARAFYAADLPSDESGVCPFDLSTSRTVAYWSVETGVLIQEPPRGLSEMVREYIRPTNPMPGAAD